jgi:hypothetical protein
MKKKLNTDVISNELSGRSAFFPGYRNAAEKDSAEGTQSTGRPTARPDGEPTTRPPARPTGRRIPVRRGFEFYEDQLVALKKRSLQEQLDGKSGNMSQMVRDALDDYLKEH